MSKPIRWTEAALTVALREKYQPPTFAFLPQVADGTGSNKSRTADAIVMGLWPSRGLDIIGFEIKVSRSAWLQELKKPAKAESIARFCDQWYVVVADVGIVKDGELPSAWGLMAPRGNGKLWTHKEAPMKEAEPITRRFLAAILRNAACWTVPKVEIDSAAVARAHAAGRPL